MSVWQWIILLGVSQLFLWVCFAYQKIIMDSAEDSIISMLKGYVGYLVHVKTDAGDVSGTLGSVGSDDIVIISSSKDVIIVPLSSLNGISKGTKG